MSQEQQTKDNSNAVETDASESDQAEREMRRKKRARLKENRDKRAQIAQRVSARLEAQQERENNSDWDEDDEDESPYTKSFSPVAPPVHPALLKPRHWAILISFFIFVLVPTLVVSAYMYLRAADQYVSQLAFSVRSEAASSALDILGGLTSISSSSSTSDTDVLYEYLQSPKLVRAVNDEIDLVSMWNAPEHDPFFSFGKDHSTEALTRHWSRMVDIFYDSSSHIIELRSHAFTPEDAQLINEEILKHSSALVNELSSISREDTTRYAREDLEQAIERLKASRGAIARFRSENLMLDPSAESQAQMGLLNTLQQQLAAALVDHDVLLQTTNESDPRVLRLSDRISVIRDRISQERRNFGTQIGDQTQGDSDGDRAYAKILEEFESLSVDKEFAEQAYVSALSAYDTAVAEAGRKTRYVAPHITPTLPEKSTAPKKLSVISLFALFTFLLWAISVLIFYAFKDRR